MRTMIPMLLLAACGGGGGCPEFEQFVYCQAVEFPSGDVIPGFVLTRDCGHASVADDYGFEETGQTAAEDWVTMYTLATGLGPSEGTEPCLALDPADLVGRSVLDYSLGRPAQFVLLATEADVDAFLNR